MTGTHAAWLCYQRRRRGREAPHVRQAHPAPRRTGNAPPSPRESEPGLNPVSGQKSLRFLTKNPLTARGAEAQLALYPPPAGQCEDDSPLRRLLCFWPERTESSFYSEYVSPLSVQTLPQETGAPRRCPGPGGVRPRLADSRACPRPGFQPVSAPPAFRRRASRPRWRSRCLWIQGSVLSRRLPGRNRYSRLTSACPGALHRTHSSWLGDGVPAARGARPPACSPPPSVQGDVHRSQLAGVGTGALGLQCRRAGVGGG